MAKRAANDYVLDPVLDFLRLLWDVEHGLQRASKRMEANLGITGPQRLVLRVVGRFPDLAAGTLADLVRLHPSTITGILQRLERRGLLRRERDVSDNRRVKLRLKAGAEVYARPRTGTVEHAVRRALDGVSRTQAHATKVVLTAVSKALHDANESEGRVAMPGIAVARRSLARPRRHQHRSGSRPERQSS